ncbi:MAG: pyridoxal phosphate-dependent aminotransferase [Muribaculaceae bacterium]|nr:pyridoxal phosphate-dependent aminotransferase [Muribaculaceae bacterium]
MEDWFDTITDRRHTASMKWDGHGDADDVLQLWVADMDFKTAPAVRRAVEHRASLGLYGYVDVPGSYYQALIRWFEQRHGWRIERDMVIYTSGVVPAVSAIIKALVKKGEKVVIQTPAYNCFFSSVRNQGCVMAENSLRRVSSAGGFTYEMDFEALAATLADPEVKLLILCNPHNPTGRVWRRDELERLRDLCHANGVRVLSDEIHCELVHAGSRAYVPYATVDPAAVVCCSPSKAFNIAGLQIANIVCPDEEVRRLVDRAINDNEVCDVNPFGVDALQAAYERGGDWLNALNAYLDANFALLREKLLEVTGLRLCNSESTYLAWVDVTGLGLTGDQAAELLLEKAKVRVSSGSIYHDNSCIRINYACPRQVLHEALRRIVEVLGK